MRFSRSSNSGVDHERGLTLTGASLPRERIKGSPVGVPATPPGVGDYVRVISGRWRIVLLATVACCILATLVTGLQRPVFRAQTSLEIQNINADFLNMKQVRPVSDESPGSTESLMDVQTQVEILQTAVLAKGTVNAMTRVGFKPEWQLYQCAWCKLNTKDKSEVSLNKVLNSVADTLKVRPAGQTRIIHIEADAANPVLAADFVNTLVDQYVQRNIESRLQMVDTAAGLTQNQLSEMRQKLAASEKGLQNYALEHHLVYTSERQNVSDDRLRQVQTDLLHARTDLVEKEARRELASSAKVEFVPDVVKDGDLRQLQAKLIDLRRHEAELLTVFKPEYTDVKKVRAQAEELESAIKGERESIVGRIDNEYQESNQREKLLKEAYDEAVERAAEESQAAVQYDILKREVDANLAAYQGMLTNVKDLTLAAALRTSNVRVVDVAEPPTKQHSPKPALNIVLGLFSGLVLGTGFVLAQEHTNQNFRHPGEATMRLGVPELGSIPSAGDIGVLGLKSLGSDNLRQTLLQKPETASKNNSDFYYSAATDDFRTILASIMFSGGRGHHPKLIVVSSSSPRDGKTTVVSNLAVTLARAGRSVLLIDGDLRRPKIHTLFDLPNTLGLGNLLENRSDAADAEEALLSTSTPRLSVLASGLFTTTPADLLFEPHLRVLLALYRERFDMVLIDSPPIMQLPDARLLGRAADGVILVARANQTTRNSMVMACDRLLLDRIRVLGVVLNDWNGKNSPYQSYADGRA
jgi:polysaccharide biosynthesis transport protein